MTAHRTNPARRGAALLVVLAVTVLTVSSLLIVARSTAVLGVARETSVRTATADDLLTATDRPITWWLSAKAPDVVVPLDAGAPQVPVLHDEWEADGLEIEIRITAWDQCGMVPLAAMHSSSPLRSIVEDASIQSLVDAVSIPRRRTAGLDLFTAAAREIEGACVFPSPDDEPAGPELPEEVAAPTELPDDRMVESSALGAFVATHNAAPGRINVNTAPMALIEAVLRRAGRGGLEAIQEARAAGERSNAPAGPRSRRGRGSRPQLVGVSDAWAFRIDVRVGGLTRSWWCVYRKPQDNKPWECAQRLAILD